ncbi:MAG: radical SAM protein [Patescibacteria group bacterium]
MKTSAPIIQQHELTSKCNNNCGFCYNPERCWSKISLPRQEDIKRNLEIAQLSVDKGVMAVCLTGGEPFLMGKHLFDVLSIYQKAGCYTSINSNGRLITMDIAEKLAKIGLNSALISIHGIEEQHDQMVGINNAFSETVLGIKNLMAAGIHVIPNFVATAKNIDQLKDVGKLIKIIGLKSMTATPFLPSWAAPDHEQFIMQRDHYRRYFQALEEIELMGVKIDSTLPIPPCVLLKFFPNDWKKYLKVLSPRVCMAGKSFGVVSPDGFFRSCIQAPYLEEYGGEVLNNYDQSWKNANAWADKKLLPEECLKCEALSVCGGGCRTSCLWENEGSAHGKTMYMGESLTAEEAEPFISRTAVWTKHVAPFYGWEEEIKIRQEKWGMIVFNPRNQSFCLLNKAFNKYLKAKQMIILDLRTLEVLQAVGAIKKVEYSPSQGEITIVPETAKRLPAEDLLPRLAKGLSENQPRQFRADTGERFFS